MCRDVFDRYQPPQEVPIEGLTHSKCRRATNLLVLFLERFSRFSLTTFYTTFIYGAQAIIDGCNTNLDSIFFVEMKAFRSSERPNPPTPSTSWSFLMTHDLLMLVLAIALALIPYVFVRLLTSIFEEHPH